MTDAERNRRALIVLAVVGVPVLAWYFLSGDDAPAPVQASVDSIPAAEQRLDRLRQLAGAVPGKEQALATVSAELDTREKGLIVADTAAQAQARLLQIVRGLARAQDTPIEIRNNEIGQVRVFGDAYGEVTVSVNFEAGIEQLINLLAAITAQKELIGTTDMRVGMANPKTKTMLVRLTVSALVRKDLVPDKKGSGF
jgi:hypothetical protein